MIEGDNLPFIEKVVYGILALLTWVGVRGYRMGSQVTEFKSRVDGLSKEIQDVKEDCPCKREELYEKLTNMVITTIDKNISSVVLEQTKVLAEMNQRLALIAQSHKDLSRKVSELGQQKIIIANPHDTGHRRRTTDPQEERDGFQ